MYRDTLIQLILKEFLSDIYLCRYLFDIITTLEKNDSFPFHQIKLKPSLYDIKLFYPGFLKTALFERFIYDENQCLDPGYTVYSIQPLTKCGHFVIWNSLPPERITDYEDPIDSSGIFIVNHLDRTDSKMIQYLNKKVNDFVKQGSIISLWYDFENQEFSNLS
jgi:hypothetical protein